MADQPQEVEIKFRIADIQTLARALPAAGFRTVTPRTHELNTLYDLPRFPLRRREAILRVRKYGQTWTVTYKDKKGARTASQRYKSRREIETGIVDGQVLSAILEAAGFKAVLAYEKYRSEWSDGVGHVLIDETPIGDFGEIEGLPSWIDTTARRLDIAKSAYITSSYAELFAAWKKKTRSKAANMLFAECG
ncbi:MAG TPA: class IV adenylate cyclase [Candidatus Angelobacter sp.]|nr:class IV adenylate cyclase [Candidatus Angelobacter sp.]